MALAGVLARAVMAGTMLSSSGNASVAPMPRNTVRRGIPFLEIIIWSAPYLWFSSGVRVATRCSDGAPLTTPRVNGVLLTIPVMIDDQLKFCGAVSLVIL